jgi:serpin B
MKILHKGKRHGAGERSREGERPREPKLPIASASRLHLVAVLLLFSACSQPALDPWEIDYTVFEPRYPAAELSPASDAITAFSFDLYRQLAPSQENFCFSPVSIATVLAAVEAGAAGTTRDEIRAVLHFEPDTDYTPSLGKVIRSLQSSHEDIWKATLANALWMQDAFPLKEAFVETLKTELLASLHPVDFSARPDAARRSMNEWFEAQGLSEPVVQPGDIHTETAMAITNALVLNLPWSEVFHEEDTRDAPFHVSDTETVTVPMMYQKNGYRFLSNEEVIYLRVHFTGPFYVELLLPSESKTLGDLEQLMSPEKLKEWGEAAQSAEVEFYLPRFSSDSKFKLNDALRAMGMGCSFDPDCADLSAMSDHASWLDLVGHVCLVEVDESGLRVESGSFGMPTASVSLNIFRADRPFLYLVRHTSGLMVAMGRLVRP